MSREKQTDEIDELETVLYEANHKKSVLDYRWLATEAYNAGYRKQKEARWVDNHCTACGMTPIGEETWTRHGETPPKFEYYMSFCPCCGAKMGGNAE